jgi:hypothetical protein
MALVYLMFAAGLMAGDAIVRKKQVAARSY